MPILSPAGGGQRLCFAEGKSNPAHHKEKKHEEDDCQNYPGYFFAACVGHSAGPGRQCAVSWVLAKTVPSAIALFNCEWLV